MRVFDILLPANRLTPEEWSTALEAFQELSNGLTPKHRKQLRLLVVATSHQQAPIQEQWKRSASSLPPVKLLSPATPQADRAWQQASILLWPSERLEEEILSGMFKHYLPILSIKAMPLRKWLDPTCSILVEAAPSHLYLVFARQLEALYFDEGALKMLVKGIHRKKALCDQTQKGPGCPQCASKQS